MSQLDELARQAIVDLHQFFEDYFTGRLDDSAIRQFEDAIAQNFHIINSDGTITLCEDIITAIRLTHNQRDNFRIWIKNATVHQRIGDTIVATYEEWQQHDEKTTSRTSTVVFQQDDTQPDKLIWLHVHESGLQVR